MNTTNNATAGKGNIIIGEAKPLDIGDLLTVFEMATRAKDKDGSVSIGADLLQRMAKELILSKASASTIVSGQGKTGQLFMQLHGAGSDRLEMKPMAGCAYAIATHPPIY